MLSRFVPSKTNSSHQNPPEMTTFFKTKMQEETTPLQQGKAVR